MPRITRHLSCPIWTEWSINQAQSSARAFPAASVAWPRRSSQSRPVVQCGTGQSSPKARPTVSSTRGAARNETPATSTSRKNRQIGSAPNPWLPTGGSAHGLGFGFGLGIKAGAFF